MQFLERNNIVRNMVRALAARCPWEGKHSTRVAVYAVATGTAMGLGTTALRSLRYAANLHDIGKLDWPEKLFSEAELSDSNVSEIRNHPIASARILGEHPFLLDAIEMVRFHHERFDGTGYPRGLSGTDIPLGARIIGLCEAFDAMENGVPWSRGATAIQSLETSAFDPEIFDKLVKAASLIQPLE